MSIVRVAKRERYVIIDKTGLEDADLSFRATGLLSYLLSKPDHWTISYRALAEVKREGEHAVLTALAELEEAGYLKRHRKQNARGQWEWEQVLYECPTCLPEDEAVPQESLHGATSTNAESRDADTPSGKSAAHSEEGSVKTDSEETDTFAHFWSLYPTRNGKRLYRAKAEDQWKRLCPPERDRAIAGVEHYRIACGTGITIAKDAFRWLRDKAFEDWQTPATPDASTNGHRGRRPPHRVDDAWVGVEETV